MGMIEVIPDPVLSSPELSWLKPVHDQGREKLAGLEWPGRRSEHWLHTPVTRAISGLPDNPPAAETVDVDALAAVTGLDAVRIVFVDGRFSASLSSDLSPYHQVLKVVSELDEAGRTAFQERLNRTFMQSLNADEHIGGWQNLAMLSDGLVLNQSADSPLNLPVHVVFVATGGSCTDPGAVRIICDLEERASATLIEHYVTAAEQGASFANYLTEVELADSSRLQHYRLGLENGDSVSLSAVHAALSASATYDAFNLSMGGNCKRHDIVVHHQDRGSHCSIKGIYLPAGSEHVDFHSCIEHRVSDCTTSEVFRGIMADKSRAVFNGRIHIHQDAQKTLAELSNRNLLLSPEAEVFTKPELEIYADDVRCAHGATVAQIDEQALYYMQSRGISRREAEVMLSFGFINELVEQIELEALAAFLKPRLVTVFSGDQSLIRHIV